MGATTTPRAALRAACALLAILAAMVLGFAQASAHAGEAYAGVSQKVDGTCEILWCNNPGPTDDDYNEFTIEMPDGQRAIGYCMDHGNAAPQNGRYSFEGTWNGASYDIVIYSDGWDNAATNAPLPCQKVGWFTWSPSGQIELVKVSANSSITDGNGCYSLAGAVYGVYGSWGDANARTGAVASMTTNDSGYALSGSLDVGSYFVREITPSRGYALDDSIYQADVDWGAAARPYGAQAWDGHLPEYPQNDPTGFRIAKVDSEGNVSKPQGDGSLEGAVFTVKYYGGDGSYSNAMRTWLLKTNEAGQTMLRDKYKVGGDDFYRNEAGDVVAPLGFYTVQETSEPEGYAHEEHETFFCEATSTGFGRVDVTWNHPDAELSAKETVKKGGLEILKRDSETGEAPQGDASLAGIGFTVRNLSANAVCVKGKWFQPGQDIDNLELATDASGLAVTGDRDLPYGTYSVRETSTNDSMLNTSKEQTFKVREDGGLVSLPYSFDDDVVRGNVRFMKLDKETHEAWPLASGGTDLSASFQIVNKSEHPVLVQGALYAAGDVVYQGKAQLSDDGWRFDTPARLLPYGTYEITETAPGTGYLKSDQAITFQIRKDGETVDLGEKTFENQIVRADLKFQKKDESTGAKMADIPFLLREKASGEAHVVVTDKNGMVDTTARGEVNAFDSIVTETGGEANQYKVDEDKFAEILAKQNDQNAGTRSGVWFGKTHDGGMAPENDGLGALPYGVYDLIELPCKANEGRQLITDQITVAREDDSRTLDFGTLDDVQPEIHTNAYDASSGNPYDNEVVADDEASITDRVTYQDLVPGREYVMTAELRDASGNPIEVGGKAVTASKKFTPDNKNGYVELTLSFDASALADGQKAVVFEKCTWNGQDVAKHEDASDAEQTVTLRKPAVATTAKAGDGAKILKLDPEARITDTVSYKNLREGEAYVLTMELVNKADGSAVLDASGNPVKATKRFTADEARGAVDVEATVDASKLDDGADLVCFETLAKEKSGKTAAEHRDLSDEGQTVKTAKPSIGTTATDKLSGTHAAATDDQATIVDSVEYKNLIADGREYTVTGTLVDKATGEALLGADSNPVTAQATFAPDAPHGFVDVTFTFDSLKLDDKTELVAFEQLYRNGVELAAHADIEDAGQTVEIDKPQIGTTAADGADGDKNVVSDSQVTVTDDVEYSGLVPGREYTVRGTLMLKGKKASAIVRGTVYEGYEALEDGSYLLADDGAGKTTLLKRTADGWILTMRSGTDGDGTGRPAEAAYELAEGDVSFADAVPDAPLADAEGEEVRAETTFTPDHAHGTAQVRFAFDGSNIPAGSQIVAFESLERNGVEIAVHADIDDAGQTVEVLNPEIRTQAADSLDGDKTVVADAQAELTDTASYENLAEGGKYSLVGVLMDKSTGLPLLTAGESGADAAYSAILAALGTDAQTIEAYEQALAQADGEAEPSFKATAVDAEALKQALASNAGIATAKGEFTAERAEGQAQVEFAFDASKWIKAEEAADCVVYEFLVHDGKLVAVHADIDDEGQSFQVAPSEVRTTAYDKTDKDQVVLPSKDCTVIDSVQYTNLIPGKEYTVRGTLMDKSTGKPLMVADKEVTAEKRFTPNTADGTVELEFAFDSSALDGKQLVAFEKVLKDQVEVACHEDLSDANQTVTVDKLNGAKGKTYSKTGLDLGPWAWAIAAAAAAGIALVAFGARRALKGRKQADGLFEE